MDDTQRNRYMVIRNISVRDISLAAKVNPKWDWGRMNWETGVDIYTLLCIKCFPGGSDSKESACNAGDLGLIPELGRSPGDRHGNPLQYSCLENPMERRAWQATVHGVTKELEMTEHLSTHTRIKEITNENLLRSTGNGSQCSVVTSVGRKSRNVGI